MNITQVNARFTIPTEDVVRLKFENRLDNTLKHHLARKLVFEIIENNLLDLSSIENKHRNYGPRTETTFIAKLLVCKEK